MDRLCFSEVMSENYSVIYDLLKTGSFRLLHSKVPFSQPLLVTKTVQKDSYNSKTQESNLGVTRAFLTSFPVLGWPVCWADWDWKRWTEREREMEREKQVAKQTERREIDREREMNREREIERGRETEEEGDTETEKNKVTESWWTERKRWTERVRERERERGPINAWPQCWTFTTEVEDFTRCLCDICRWRRSLVSVVVLMTMYYSLDRSSACSVVTR